VLVKGFVDEVVEDFSAIRPHDGLNMMAYEKIGEISVAKILRDFIGGEVLPGTNIGAGQFWSGLAGLVGEFAPRIRDQLRFRDELQERSSGPRRCCLHLCASSPSAQLAP
jgi:hypothetical protein